MGGSLSSNVYSMIEEEFDRVLEVKNRYAKLKKDYISIDDARKHLQSPMEQYPINFHKLPILYLLDRNQDGKYTKDDVIRFCEKIASVVKQKQIEREFASEVTSYAILIMWHAVTVDRDGFVRWLVRAMILDHRIDIPRYPDIVYVSVDVISVLYEVFDIPQMFEGVNIQQLIDLMQKAGEEEGLMDLQDPEMTNVVPASIVRYFSESFVNGFKRIMSRLGFMHDQFFENESYETKASPEEQYENVDFEEDDYMSKEDSVYESLSD